MSCIEQRVTHTCFYETERMEIAGWHSFPASTYDPERLPVDVAGILTERVTASLPPQWHGDYSLSRAASWIAERDAEGTTLLALDKKTSQAIGFMILFETNSVEAQVELRLGYLLAESSWGRGFATEMLSGLIQWCRTQSSIRSIVGGVARDNPASRRVLEKLGFQLAHSSQGEDIFEIVLEEV